MSSCTLLLKISPRRICHTPNTKGRRRKSSSVKVDAEQQSAIAVQFVVHARARERAHVRARTVDDIRAPQYPVYPDRSHMSTAERLRT